MPEPAQFISEFVCGNCARTGHVTWEGEGSAKRIVERTENIQHRGDGKTSFACAHCGAALGAI
jgi:hypothetical protein